MATSPLQGCQHRLPLRGATLSESVNPAVIFLYLPLPYWAAFVVLLYKHDLSRLFRPLRDNGSVRNWWVVLDHLGLVKEEGVRRMPSRKSEPLSYLIYLLVALVVSLSWVLKLYPTMSYYLVVAQGISAIVLTAAAMRYLGPPPRRPYADVLRFPRLGSRIRHLGKVPVDKRGETK